MPPDASAGYLSSCRWRTKSKAAANAETAAYPRATNPNCNRDESNLTTVFYRRDGQGCTTESLWWAKSSIRGVACVPATFRKRRWSQWVLAILAQGLLQCVKESKFVHSHQFKQKKPCLGFHRELLY